MGSLSSTPSVPSTQVVYVPQTTTATTTTQSAAEVDAAAQDAESESRSEGLLRRNRGLLGTVQTSFSGILNGEDTTAARKTLLGE